MELRIWPFVLPIMLRYLRSGAGEKCLWLIQEIWESWFINIVCLEDGFCDVEYLLQKIQRIQLERTREVN